MKYAICVPTYCNNSDLRSVAEYKDRVEGLCTNADDLVLTRTDIRGIYTVVVFTNSPHRVIEQLVAEDFEDFTMTETRKL